jgi:uncharacterized membrane protein YqaE (UPF0057 family)
VYLLAIIFPPLAVLLCGKPFQALMSFLLMLCLWFPGVIYAWLVVGEYKADRRTDKLVAAIDRQGARSRRRREEREEAEADNPFAF